VPPTAQVSHQFTTSRDESEGFHQALMNVRTRVLQWF
jgi:hypothetical protein